MILETYQSKISITIKDGQVHIMVCSPSTKKMEYTTGETKILPVMARSDKSFVHMEGKTEVDLSNLFHPSIVKTILDMIELNKLPR